MVVGSRAEPRSATPSAVPVDVLSATDLLSQGAGDPKDQLRTVIPSFNANTHPISGGSTVVRPAMLRNLAPDHTLVLINGKRRHRSSVLEWHGGNGGTAATAWRTVRRARTYPSSPRSPSARSRSCGTERRHAGTWNRYNVAAYGDIEATGTDDAWTLGTAVRIENFEDFGTTANGKVSGRFGFVRGSVSTGFRAPTPGQQNGFNISSWFDPTVGDLINNAVIPSISPVAQLRGGRSSR